MKEIIQQLIADGRTEEALNTLAKTTDDAILLLSRYNSGKKQFNMGLIEFGEWSRIQNQINYAALELADRAQTPVPPSYPTPTPAPAARKKVFISYNHKNGDVMERVKAALEAQNIAVHVDVEDMQAGTPIQEFIDNAFKTSDMVLSVISRQSLMSGWVNKELNVAKVLKTLQSAWIPVSIDDAIFNPDFIFEAYAEIDQKREQMRERLQKALDADMDLAAFTAELKRQQDLKNSLSDTIAELKNILVIDITGDQFEAGMRRVLQKINGAG